MHTSADFFVIDGMHRDMPHIVATYLLAGDAPALVDPGPTSGLHHVEAGLAAHGLALGDIQAILLTHIHLDHAGATGTIVARHPQIKVYVHERGATHMIAPERLYRSAARLYGEMMDELWGEMRPVPEAAITTLSGGETLDLGGRTIPVFDAPGHAPHHLVYFDTASGTACVGDTAGIRLPGHRFISPATPPPDIDLDVWMHSLDLIMSLQPHRLALTHFGLVDDPVDHIERYRKQLWYWANELKTGLDAGEDEAALMARLRALTDAELGADHQAQAAYQTASPVELNWAGLARYWRKRAEREAA